MPHRPTVFQLNSPKMHSLPKWMLTLWLGNCSLLLLYRRVLYEKFSMLPLQVHSFGLRKLLTLLWEKLNSCLGPYKHCRPCSCRWNPVHLLYFERIGLTLFVHKIHQLLVFSLNVLLLEYWSHALLFASILVQNLHNFVWFSLWILWDWLHSDKHGNLRKRNKLKDEIHKNFNWFCCFQFLVCSYFCLLSHLDLRSLRLH